MFDTDFGATPLRQTFDVAHDGHEPDFARPWSLQDWRDGLRANHTVASTDAATTPAQSFSLNSTALGSTGLAAINSLLAHSSFTAFHSNLDTQSLGNGSASLTQANTQFDNHIAPALNAFVSDPKNAPQFVNHDAMAGNGTSFTLPPPTTQSGMTINITYDPSVSSAPAGFQTAVAAAVSYLESQFNDPITINIHVGYGEYGYDPTTNPSGTPLDSGALGESESFLLGPMTFDDLKTALTADGHSADDATAIASLVSDPTGGGNFFMTVAEARALGLYTASDSQLDGYVGFDNTGSTFDYNNSDGVSSGLYDFYDVVLHELTEVMGRQLEVGGTIGSTTNAYEPLDLFHYSGAGTRLLVGTSAGYFSIDGGTTHQKDFNTDPSGDFGDWAASAGNDAFLAFSGPGAINGMSEADLKEMDILGFDRLTGGGTPDLTANTLSFANTTLSFHINNAGSAVAGASTAGIYLSTDSTITTADTRINTHATPALASGATDPESVVMALPTGLTPGTYYIGVIADYSAAVAESNEANNASAGSPIILGNDSVNTLTGTAGADAMFALGGDDTINMGANLTAADQIDGGTGNDTVTLNGNYSAGLTFGANTMVNVETMTLTTGNSYKFTTNDATVAAGQQLKVIGSSLAAGNNFTFNGAAETNGTFYIYGGAGTNILTGGAGNDTFSMGAAFAAADQVNGGGGTDTLGLNGNYSAGLTFGATTMVSVESLYLTTGNSYKLTTNDATVAAGQQLIVNGSALVAGNTLTFNGAAETNGTFYILGGAGTNILTGGAGNDTFSMGATFTAADQLNGGAGAGDTLVLSGNYSAGLTFGATTMVNVETMSLITGNSYKLTTNDATVAAGQRLLVSASSLAAGNTLTFNGAAETNGTFYILGGAGTDILTGGAGNDVFSMGAHLTAADQLNGGAGTDTLYLNGNYSAGLTFGATTMVNVEAIYFFPGNSYKLTTNDATVASGQNMVVSGSSLLAGSTLTFNGAAETNGTFTMYGGAGTSILTGGAGNDTFSMGAAFIAADQINGGAGTDLLILNGNYSAGLTFGATTMVNIETLTLTTDNSYKLTTNDATVAAGQQLEVIGSSLAAGNTLTFNGAAETNGTFDILGGAGTNILTGGAGNDTFSMGAHLTAADQLNGGAGTDLLILNGNYSAGLTLGATTLVNVETMYFSPGNNYSLTTNDATVASGQNLLVNGTALAAANTLTFNGSAETNGTFTIKGGAGNDVLSGGAGNDLITGGAGADTLTGNGGADHFIYNAVAESMSTHYDTITDMNFSTDLIDLTFAVTGIDAALTTGALNTATFDSDLTTALSGHLNASHAILFTPNSGTLSGQTFLIIDSNNSAGYQASADLVIHLTSPTGTLATTDFI